MNKRVLIGALVISFASAAAAAQDKPTPVASKIVPGSHYKPLDFWTNLKIGAAYYTSPASVSTFKFAYTYNPEQISTVSTGEIDKWLADGSAKVGVVKNDGVVEALKIDDVDTWASAVVKYKENAVLISPNDSLGGIKSSNSLISTQK